MTEYIATQSELKLYDGSTIGSRIELAEPLQEIVRCRDCKFFKHWSWADGSYAYECAICEYNDMVEPNGFCAWGERKVVC